MLGIQTPILLAIIEYGILLGFRKYNRYENGTNHSNADSNPSFAARDRKSNLDKIERWTDRWTAIMSLAFMAIFSLIYYTSTQTKSNDSTHC